ncbi:iron-sulfur cluster assembly protein [Phycicoccus duodecadis]|uniref:Metal-sulfur cluster biosynthetic enzyme n=1 Tax=Phycicoccus duodecadis TaxID=173053 RepID=A0A2N3YIX3_9MICO|nr:iron-sulfur cluster assembly protein [Phycicoccus duodecadis]PKW26806.1 metal-sulfur cluster biosynthetic enzyme [Phycicoccus duodecadis]
MTALATRPVTEEAVRGALGAVLDPELDEPITDLGFVRSVAVDDGDVTVHLRLPTSFCSPNFAYLMASDSKDAVTALEGVGVVVVELDDHHDSDLINAGLAADAGYVGTFRHEAEQDLDELRATFRRKAHTAAMERALTVLLRAGSPLAEGGPERVRLGDLPAGRERDALLRRREALGLSRADDAPVLVDHEGRPPAPGSAAMFLRRARATRVSIDGNAHFCRGLLRTRYEGSGADQRPRPEGAEPTDHHHLLPLSPKES